MKRPNKTISKFNVRDFTGTLVEKLSDSIGDMVITIAITGITIAFMVQTVHPVYVQTVPGFYIAGMLTQLFIRIVHRFDDSYTTDEVGRQLQRIEDEINTRLDNVIANLIP